MFAFLKHPVLKPHLWLIRFVGLLVPRRLRADWRQEWEAELRWREAMLAEWDKLSWQNKLDLFWRSTSAFWDALWLQPKRWEDEMMQDLRYGMRMLRKHKGFSAVAVLTLALGIGANTAIFSLLNTALLRPLPIAQPEQMVSISQGEGNGRFSGVSYPNYRDVRDRNDVFAGVIGYRFAPLSLSHDGINERLWGYVVSGNYFDVLGVKPLLGRVITPEDDRNRGAHPVVVLSHQCWQQRFGGTPSVLGKNIVVNGGSYTVIGVAPQGFYGTEVIAAPEVWFPMMMQAQLEAGNDWLDKRGVDNIFVMGRLKPGVNVIQAQSAMDAIGQQLAREYPEFNEGKGLKLSAPGWMGGGMRAPLLGFVGVLMFVVILVLLLACTNLANLLLARATERRKEIAVRLALGVSRFRLLRQLLTESVLLALGAGALGVVLAWWLIRLAIRFKPPIDVPLQIDLHLDYRVLLFAAGISLLTGVLFGLLPAWQATKTDLLTALKDDAAIGTQRRSWLKNSLIVFQVALSLVLLVGGGLMVRALQKAETVQLGFNPNNAIELSFDLRLQGYEQAQIRESQKRLLERVRALPGVQEAGLADLVPVDLHMGTEAIFIEGQLPERDARAPRAYSNRVTPGYFGAMGTRLLQGRDFTVQDSENAPRVVIINESFARRFWPGQDPIGRQFRLSRADAQPVQIIGVAQDGKYANLNEDAKPFVFRPLWQSFMGSSTLVVRSVAESQQMMAAVRNELQQLDPNLPIASAKTMVEHLSFPLLPTRVAASVFGSFGLLGLALAAIGLYGVMSYSVSKRIREIGIRMALGAQSKDVLRLTINQGMKLVLLGVVIGLVGALALTRVMKTLLMGVSATDPLTFVGTALLLTFVAWLACFLPARRATKVDPIIALRHD
ncbi:MAG: ABC transporter permease [Acidobacteria bacterium]|nr:ABC transporter permease [Acidobacteriota bacterium]